MAIDPTVATQDQRQTQNNAALVTVEWADQHAPAGYAAAKRLLDLVASGAVLLIGSPLWLLVALLIKLTSPGPVFYRGTVVGKGGVAFRYFKFRTMVAGGDNTAHKQWLEQFVKSDTAFATDASGKPVFKVVNDPRVTKIGRWLRKLSLDGFSATNEGLWHAFPLMVPVHDTVFVCLLYTSPSPRDRTRSRMPSSA